MNRQPPRCQQHRLRRQGFTLLEVILALALSFLVLMGVAMAMDLHLRMLDKRQSEIEQSQLSRSVLQIIREDIRGAVQYTPYDTSALEQVIAGLDPLGADAAAAVASGDLSGLESGDGGAGGTGGGGTGGGMTSTETGGSAGPTSSASQDVVSSIAPPTRPGVYGNETALMIDVSRLPRRDQLLYSQTLGGTALLPSDIKTIAYYVASSATTVQGTSGSSAGLVRREVDRAVTRYAMDSGGGADLAAAEEVIAPEITAIYFRYFDGTDWQAAWDSDELGRLPVAIEVTVQIGGQDTATNASAASNLQKTVAETHTIVVYLPISEAPTEADAEESANQESASGDQSDSADE